MLLALPIEGRVVNGRVLQDNAIHEELLVAPLCEDTTRGQGINLKYLKQHDSSIILTEDLTGYEKIIKTRCFIMILFGHFLFPETTGNTINIMYLSLLRNINKIRTYSYGSTVLSHLYSSLCKNAQKDTCSFYSCAFLLQTRGWSRMLSLAPVNENKFTFPFATK